MQYRMFSDTELKDFRAWMATCPFDRSAEGAYDSKPKGMSRRAKDADPEAVARGLAAMLLELKSQLGTEAFRALCDQVCEGDEPEAEDDDPATEFASPAEREMSAKPTGDKRKAKDTKRKAMDDPEPFEGKPSTGTAMDAATDPRFDYVVDMQRVKPSRPGAAYGDVSSKIRRAPSTANAERSFGEMYGAAAVNIKVR